MPAAREFARQALVGWGLGELADAVLLCVSELATNALLHGVPAGRGFLLRLAVAEEGPLRIEVHDSGDGHPCLVADSGAGCESGRGLLLVEALSEKWGEALREPGKIVWCEFACGDAEAVETQFAGIDRVIVEATAGADVLPALPGVSDDQLTEAERREVRDAMELIYGCEDLPELDAQDVHVVPV
ncbi:ATP-binding protein [Streptomyces sp. H39-C1]|uniref:ATP-binding protein n=1 Tax=Streptomyces sp. H39-C1 TaxID=3004355 RepID=UPI002F35DEE9